MADRSESAISSSVTQRWEARGGIVVRVQSGKVPVRGGWMQLAERGTPDLYVMAPHGQAFWAETKTERGKLSEDQQRWHMKARRLGHLVFVVRDEASADAAWKEATSGVHVYNL